MTKKIKSPTQDVQLGLDMEYVQEAVEQTVSHDDEMPQSQTLRKVEVLANLANACRNKEIVKAIKSLPDGDIILKIFVDSLQSKINSIMTGTQDSEIADRVQTLVEDLNSVGGLAGNLQNFFVKLHQSPLIQTLQALNANLTNRPPQPQPNSYAQPQYAQQPAPAQPAPPQQQAVSPEFESQVEQTPKFTKQRSTNNNGLGPAPTAPPRGGFNSW